MFEFLIFFNDTDASFLTNLAKSSPKKSDTNFFFKMRQIGRLGSGIVEMGAVKRLIV